MGSVKLLGRRADHPVKERVVSRRGASDLHIAIRKLLNGLAIIWPHVVQRMTLWPSRARDAGRNHNEVPSSVLSGRRWQPLPVGYAGSSVSMVDFVTSPEWRYR